MDVWYPLYFVENVDFIIRSNAFFNQYLTVGYDMRVGRIESLQKTIDDLYEKIDYLTMENRDMMKRLEECYFSPNMPGYELAKQDFEMCRRKHKRRRHR